jgi:hypothetical protein
MQHSGVTQNREGENRGRISKAQESIQKKNQFRQPMYCSLAGQYDNPIATRVRAHIL